MEEARQAALRLTREQIDAQPHVRCRVAMPPVFEGHLTKLLCAVEHAQLPALPAPLQPASQRQAAQLQAGPQPTAAARPASGWPMALPPEATMPPPGVDATLHGALAHAESAATRVDAPQTQPIQAVDNVEPLRGAEAVFVFVDKPVEAAARLRLQEGEALVLLPPWDVVAVPGAVHPVVLAYVVVAGD